MRVLMLVAVTYVAVVVQTSVCPSLEVGGATADVLVLEALAVVLLSASPYSFLWAGWLGLLHDLVSPGQLGPCMFWLTVAGYLVVRVRRQLYTEQVLVQAALVALGTSVVLGGVGATRVWLGEASGEWSALIAAAGGGAVYTGVLAWPVFFVAGRWARSEPAWGV